MWIAKGINVTHIQTGDTRFNNAEANIQTEAGVGWNLPIQKVIIDPGVTVKKLRIPNNGTHGYVEIENNGTIAGTGVVSDHPVENSTSYTTIVSGSGTIGSRKGQRFSFVSGSNGFQSMIGGMGGASSPDFYHIPKYGRSFGAHLARLSAGTGSPVTVVASSLITSQSNTVANPSTIDPVINTNGRLYTQQLFASGATTGTSQGTFTVNTQGTYRFYVAYIINGPNAFTSGTGVFNIYKNGVHQRTINLFTTSGSWKSQTDSIYLFVGESLRIESTFPSSNSSAAYVYVGADSYNTSTLTPDIQGNDFRLYWTYNECDYVNLGGGDANLNATGIFTNFVDAQGNILGGGSQQYQIALGGRRRDYRDVTVGTAVLNDGNRYWWVCSNAKRNWGMYIDFSQASNGYCRYVQPRWRDRRLDNTNANFSSLATSKTDQNPFAGPVDYNKYTGIIQGV